MIKSYKKIIFLTIALSVFYLFAPTVDALNWVDEKVTEKTLSGIFQDINNANAKIEIKIIDPYGKVVSTEYKTGTTEINFQKSIVYTKNIYNFVRGVQYTLTAKELNNPSANTVNTTFTTVKTDTRTKGTGSYWYTTDYDLQVYDSERAKSYYRFSTLSACESARTKNLQTWMSGANGYSGTLFTPCFKSNTEPTKAEFSAKLVKPNPLPRYFFEYDLGGVPTLSPNDNFTKADCESDIKNFVPGTSGKNELLKECYEVTSFDNPKPKTTDGPNPVAGNSSNSSNEELSDNYKLLAPLPGLTEVNNDSVGTYINKLIKFAIGFTAVLSIVMIILGGIQYMTSSDSFSEKEGAGARIRNAVLGLLIALGAYALLNTINPALVTGSLSFKQAVINIDPESDIDPHPNYKDAKYGDEICDQKVSTNYGNYEKTEVRMGYSWPKESPDLRPYLNSVGMDIKSGPCKNAGDDGCVSLVFNVGYFNRIVPSLKKLAEAYKPYGTKNNGVRINMTGGTECWSHKTHGPESARFDFSAKPAFNEFVTSEAKVVKRGGKILNETIYASTKFPRGCKKYVIPTIGEFYAEGVGCDKSEADHWHVTLNI